MTGRTPLGGPDACRIECQCREPAVLLATMSTDGYIHIKSRDRSWRIYGEVNTECPRCGCFHIINSDPQESEGIKSQ